MPELPDLHVYAGNLRKRILDRPIVSAEVFNRARVSVTPATFELALVGSRFQSIERDGKELVFGLSNGQSFSVHLMLCGKFHLASWKELATIYSKVVCIGLEGPEYLVVTDYQGKAKVTFNPVSTAVPDALSEAFTYDYLARLLSKKSGMNIKELLVDQRLVKGIGNAYVDEILWKANISPRSVAGRIPPEAVRALYEAIGWVLLDAIEQILRLSPDSIQGEERSFLRVHKPKQKTDPNGEPIVYEEVAKRGTYYTAKQRLYV